jgi:hypothetical protein
VVCRNCHIIRHLKQIGEEWVYISSELTPREMIAALTRGEWSHGESNPDLQLAKLSSSR